MLNRMILAIFSLFLLMPGALADDEKPTVAILTFGSTPNTSITHGGVLDVLESYGFISAEENRSLKDGSDLQGANINIHWGEAFSDAATANLLLDAALDQGADVLLTHGTKMAQIAIQATSEMDEPTPVIFMAAPVPYETGIAEASCVKADHVTGTSIALSYEFVFSALKMQNPDFQRVGTIYSSDAAGGVFGSARIAEVGEAYGVSVDVRAVTAVSDLRAAAISLAEAGAEAFILPVDDVVTIGLPIVVGVAKEVGAPVFFPSFSAIYHGATIGAGASPFYEQGINAGVLLAAHLKGELDIARTAISTIGEFHIGVNLDSANTQGVEISDEVMQEAIVVISGGRTSKLSPGVLAAIARRGVIVSMEERLETDSAWLKSLQCSDEMIAEQQADLDAAGE